MGLFSKLKNKKKISETQEVNFTDDIQQEVDKELHFYVNSGFFSQSDIYMLARDIFENICLCNDIKLPSDSYIKQTVDRLLTEVNPVSKNNQNYIRLKNIFDTLNREHIIAIHFAGYTLDDGFEEVKTVSEFMKSNNIFPRGYCFYHQQDIERAMDESIKNLFLAFHSMNNDKQIAVEVGKRVVELLIEHGFDVQWDQSPDSRIEIKNFVWDKEYDKDDYGTDRAIRIMSEV